YISGELLEENHISIEKNPRIISGRVTLPLQDGNLISYDLIVINRNTFAPLEICVRNIDSPKFPTYVVYDIEGWLKGEGNNIHLYDGDPDLRKVFRGYVIVEKFEAIFLNIFKTS
ncbi:MAG: hypothetical protein IH845_02285, partial [Nanoarchaeota archaeon]|nr:hypothetical protein [Nanoarchaeota archaeon]